MIARIKHWFVSLSRREQILVSIFAALLAIVIGIYGIILPFISAYSSVRQDYSVAVEDSARLSAKLDLLGRGNARAQTRLDGSLHQIIAESAAEKGFTVDSNNPMGNDSTTITISSASASAFFAWINELEQQGIRLETLSISPTANGTISVNASFMSAS
ncbi:type II secretion system protein GspM [Sphingorhabdus sp. Alg239-R122]|uniref:type II secretion system protein GspM n=1 Tax=Sphingorhabdus sp. Alg239-R122 TaxID=2305989 RepID=UPI0013DC0BB6|nr:type II secretion system protein GspM [Sphingorhabdus sp. Alg239-R122]